MKWFEQLVCVGLCCTGLLGQAVAQTSSLVVPPTSGSVPPSTRVDGKLPLESFPDGTPMPSNSLSNPSTFDIPEISPVALPSTPGKPGVPAQGSSRSAEQQSLSGLLAANRTSSTEANSTNAANMVFLKFEYGQGNPVYLIDERRREGLVFFSVPIQEFQRITKTVLPELEPGLLTQVPLQPELHTALKQLFAGSLFQIELPTGLEHSPDGGVRVVTTLESKATFSNLTNRESNE